MSDIAARRAYSLAAIPGWLAALGLILLTLSAGAMLGSPVRTLFIVGCLGVGLHAWSRGPGEHAQAALLLFVSAPFLRRIVDVPAGYDPSSLMLLGPMLVLLAPLPELYRRVSGALPSRPVGAAMQVVGGCVAYATFLTLLQGEWMNAATGSIKWIAPLVYAVAIQQRPHDAHEILPALSRTFMVVLPITGLYGVHQYVDPQLWDRYWLAMAPITSAGLPEAYQVRVFSTMNGPASFATFTATGLLLVYFLRPGWTTIALMLPAGLAVLLSLYRTAWISLFAAILFCALFAPLRARALASMTAVAAAILVTVLFTPFGDVVTDRLATLGDATGDASGQERLQQYGILWSLPDSELFGNGFSPIDTRVAGAIPVDGMIITCWTSMGIVVGLTCLAALLAAGWSAIAAAARSRTPELLVTGALAFGSLVQLPLANVTSGELGFLFWTFITLASLPRQGEAAR